MRSWLITLWAVAQLFVCLSEATTVTSLNIQWFGRGGIMQGQARDEFRQDRLREFIYTQLPKTDVFVFQEITQPKMLQYMLPELSCFTYSATTQRHQYVMICHKKEWNVVWRTNFDVQLGRDGLRPALVGNFWNLSGESFAVVGVHLKAGPRDSETRLDQIRALKTELTSHKKVVLIGDFNTYTKDKTGKMQDDASYMNQHFQQFGFVHAELPAHTYLSYRKNKFDHIWTKGIDVEGVGVSGPCTENSVSWPFESYDFYRQFISDHCAVYVNF
jgi:endonuclease/exonuclease/phosphatase family metal-dependent hydrolase